MRLAKLLESFRSYKTLKTAALKLQAAFLENPHTVKLDMSITHVAQWRYAFELKYLHGNQVVLVILDMGPAGDLFVRADEFQEEDFDDAMLPLFVDTVVRELMNMSGELTNRQQQSLIANFSKYLALDGKTLADVSEEEVIAIFKSATERNKFLTDDDDLGGYEVEELAETFLRRMCKS